MMQFKIDADTTNAENKVTNLANSVNKLQGIANGSNSTQPIASTMPNQPIVQNNAQKLLIQQQSQIENNNNLNSSILSFIDNMDFLNKTMLGFADQVKSVSSNLSGLKNGLNQKVGSSFKDLGAMTLLTGGISAAAEYEASLTRRRIRGYDADVFGMEREEISGRANAITAGSSSLGLLGGAIGSFIPGIGSVAGTMIGQSLGSLISTFAKSQSTKEIAAIDEIEKKASKFESRLPTLEKAMFAFGKPSNDALRNRTTILDFNSIYTEAANGTGLDSLDFANKVTELASYGNMSHNRAIAITRNAALASRFTNTDVGILSNFMGSRARFGSADTELDMNHAYSAMIKSGMQKEMFGEFLQGLQDVVETGIARGYVASTDEISKQMLSFSLMNKDDPTWQGKYGFQKLQQINSGLANSTSLSNSGQILAYQALRGIVKDEEGLRGGAYIKGADYLNTFSLMEAGLNSKSFKAIQNVLNNRYGDNETAKTLAWKEISGLNYTGAMKLAEMGKTGYSDGEIEKALKEFKANPEFETDQTKMQNAVNDIQRDVAKIATGDYDKKYEKVLGLEDKQKIESRKQNNKTYANFDEWLEANISKESGENLQLLRTLISNPETSSIRYYSESQSFLDVLANAIDAEKAGGVAITEEESKKLRESIEMLHNTVLKGLTFIKTE